MRYLSALVFVITTRETRYFVYYWGGGRLKLLVHANINSPEVYFHLRKSDRIGSEKRMRILLGFQVFQNDPEKS